MMEWGNEHKERWVTLITERTNKEEDEGWRCTAREIYAFWDFGVN